MRAYGPMTKNAFILNFLKLYNMAWQVALPFLKKNKRLKKGYQKRTSGIALGQIDIWIQAASAGEAYLAINLVKFLTVSSNLSILITSTTSQGLDILTNQLKNISLDPMIDVTVDWFPFDTSKAIQNSIQSLNPKVMVLLETEIWPALLYYLKKNQTRILIVNARLSKRSFNHYKHTKFLWNHLSPDTILATSDQDAYRYKQIFDSAKVKAMSNIKFESALVYPPESNSNESINKILPQDLPLTIFASIRTEEEEDVVSILKEVHHKFDQQTIAIFPRHMHRIDAWKTHLTKIGFDFLLRSEINSPLKKNCIILWDIFGELTRIYSSASVVFVGGSLKPLGGQNIIEPAITGAVTITGPYNDDFKWVKEQLFSNGIVLQAHNLESVSQTILKNLIHPPDRSMLRNRAIAYIESNQGGTETACREILKAFDELH